MISNNLHTQSLKDSAMSSFHNCCDADHSVFYEQTDMGKILLIVCVDDIVIKGDDKGRIIDLKSFLFENI